MLKEVFDEKKIEKVFKRLCDIDQPRRIDIIKLLSEVPKMNVTQIQNKLNVREQALSYHLRVLRLSGILNVNREGKAKFYSINEDNFQHLLAWIDMVIQ